MPDVLESFYLIARRQRGRFVIAGSLSMQHDVPLRAAARAIYDAVYPSEDWTPVGFDQAERYRTIHYRQAVQAAQLARLQLSTPWVEQLAFL